MTRYKKHASVSPWAGVLLLISSSLHAGLIREAVIESGPYGSAGVTTNEDGTEVWVADRALPVIWIFDRDLEYLRKVPHAFDSAGDREHRVVSGLTRIETGAHAGRYLLLFQHGDFAIIDGNGATVLGFTPFAGLPKRTEDGTDIFYGGVDAFPDSEGLAIVDVTHQEVVILDPDGDSFSESARFEVPVSSSAVPPEGVTIRRDDGAFLVPSGLRGHEALLFHGHGTGALLNEGIPTAETQETRFRGVEWTADAVYLIGRDVTADRIYALEPDPEVIPGPVEELTFSRRDEDTIDIFWQNGFVYNEIGILLNGVRVALLPSTETRYTYHGFVGGKVSVRVETYIAGQGGLLAPSFPGIQPDLVVAPGSEILQLYDLGGRFPGAPLQGDLFLTGISVDEAGGRIYLSQFEGVIHVLEYDLAGAELGEKLRAVEELLSPFNGLEAPLSGIAPAPGGNLAILRSDPGGDVQEMAILAPDGTVIVPPTRVEGATSRADFGDIDASPHGYVTVDYAHDSIVLIEESGGQFSVAAVRTYPVEAWGAGRFVTRSPAMTAVAWQDGILRMPGVTWFENEGFSSNWMGEIFWFSDFGEPGPLTPLVFGQPIPAIAFITSYWNAIDTIEQDGLSVLLIDIDSRGFSYPDSLVLVTGGEGVAISLADVTLDIDPSGSRTLGPFPAPASEALYYLGIVNQEEREGPAQDLTVQANLSGSEEVQRILLPHQRSFRRSYPAHVGAAEMDVVLTNHGDLPARVRVLVSATAELPAAPTDLTIVDVTGDAIAIEWQDNAVNETGYEVERKVGDGEFTLVAQLPPGTQNFTDTGILSGVSYSYRVRAVSPAGPSPYSNEVSHRPGGQFVRMDLDGDQALKLADALWYLTNFLFGSEKELDCPDAADANDDGKLGLSDAIFMLSVIFLPMNIRPDPFEPFPTCGSDPTPDDLDTSPNSKHGRCIHLGCQGAP